ncbi:MAG: Inosine-5'-monophosphate dehydrogenase [Candidatus Falkowbacteria bacterium GW2011_GWA2_39_24]|uniref:Inosine-5'-monophosphate dehydrogenase n=1 Tax=Candidatus Falkowbacteria bacterium GW2011_GWA2_39_24 TaxID=1618634 RepID=A0A0G0RLL2_9BACT|nr:MAG: Inosine-5'-monophosphate dehydrogenase [Candidatus Falkowbacteria bacterium GW2011_GWA2_39_24]
MPRRKVDAFFQIWNKNGTALTFRDVRLKTRYSEVILSNIDLSSRFSRNVKLKIPIISSPMDTVTEYQMAIAMAKLGGLGIIHRNLNPETQAKHVKKVRSHLNAIVTKPTCVKPEDTVLTVKRYKAEHHLDFSSFPVVDADGKLVGIVTKDDFDYCSNDQTAIRDIMTGQAKLITAKSNISMKTAYKMMLENRIKILPLVNSKYKLIGMYTLSDVKRTIEGNAENYNLDAVGNLQVGAAIGVGQDAEIRMESLNKAGINVVVIDTAHGDSQRVIDTVKWCKKHYPNIDVVAGNVSEFDSAKHLLDIGIDGLRVGQGGGSICSTRIVAGVGCPQVTAVYNCALALRNSGVPVCADGGLESSGDIAVALGAGADNVMLGKLLAGTKETPGQKIYRNGVPMKAYRGMGSGSAMRDNQASRERYHQEEVVTDKLVPEGVEAVVPYKGDVEDTIDQLLGGLRSGLGYVGAHHISEFHEQANFWRITAAGYAESMPHGITVVDDSGFSGGRYD